MKRIKKGYKENIVKLLTILFCIFPWITYAKILEYNEAERHVFSSYEGLTIDFFLYYKEMILIVTAVFLVCWFIGERIFPDKVDNNVPLLRGKNKGFFLMICVFLGTALLATLFAAYQKNAWWGSPSEGEGMLTLIGYVILMLAFYNYFAKEYAIGILKKGISILSIVTVILSLVEYFYKPLLEIGLLQKLIAPAEYAELLSTATAEAFDGAVALTFNNPSYYGVFVCLLIPFAIASFLDAKEKVELIANGVLMAGLMFCIIVSNSTAALYVAMIEFVLLICMHLIKAQQKKVSLIKCAVVLLSVFIAIGVYGVASGNSIWDIVTNANSATGKVVEDRFIVENIELKNNSVLIQGEKVGFQVVFADGQIEICDENGEKLEAEYVDGSLIFLDEAYENVSIGLIVNSEANAEILAKILVDAGYDDTIDFFILKDGTISGIGQNNAILMDIEGVEIPEEWKQYYGIFTGRGYAWANSLPILKDTVLKGVGPGNFAYYFKQQDYVGMLQTHGSTKYVIDKPHNAYLQYAINLGIPGMLCFFGILAYAASKAFTQWGKNKKSNTIVETVQTGGMVAIIGFAISSLMNDSIITVTPTLCMIVGAVMAASYMLAGGNTDGKAKK